MTKTHPDIVSIVNSVARFGSQHTNAWVATKRIFRYQRGTTKLGLLYKNKECHWFFRQLKIPNLHLVIVLKLVERS